MAGRIIILLLLGLFFSASAYCEEIKPPKIRKDSAAYRSAQKIADHYHSKEFQEMLRKEKGRLAPKYKTQKQAMTNRFKINSDAEDQKYEILIFISESMPPEAIRPYVRHAHRLGDIVDITVLVRGRPKQGLTPFLNRIGANEYPIHFSINPLAFGKFQINTVPAVIVNETYGVRHPEGLRAALSIIESKTETDLSDLIYALSID